MKKGRMVKNKCRKKNNPRETPSALKNQFYEMKYNLHNLFSGYDIRK